MYRSHPVRRMCEDPIPDETTSLVVEPESDGADRAALESALSDLGGSIDDELRFGSFLVTIPEEAVETLCSMDGLARVETAGTLGLGIGEE